MKLNEKIWVCRKQAGLSQEALAEKIGVSRQAISKWETGEAAPEISKLPLLARTFGVTVDWLLDDEAGFDEDTPEEEPASPVVEEADIPVAPAYPEWIDHLPGFLARMLKKYGWIFGLRMAISGALFTGMGMVGKAMFSSMDQSFNGMVSGMYPANQNAGITFFDEAGNMVDPSHFGLSAGDVNALFGGGGATGFSPFGGVSVTASMTEPPDILCNFIICIGLVMLIGGALLAWYLKKKGQESL